MTIQSPDRGLDMARLLGKDASLEDSLAALQGALTNAGFELEEFNWLNPLPNIWSVQVRDKNCPLLLTDGKGITKDAARASALGEFVERLSCNQFFANYFLGSEIAQSEFVHYPNERWFEIDDQGTLSPELLDEPTLMHYNFKGNLISNMLVDRNSGASERGVVAVPFVRQLNQQEVWLPVNLIGNLFASNGQAAGNSKYEARVQALSKIFERHIKNTIISSGISLPVIPEEVLAEYPVAYAAVQALREQGFGVVVQDGSLGGKYPLVNVVLLNPENAGCCASFGAHPKFEVAFERAITEMMQGRTLDQLNEFSPASFDVQEVAESHNIESHFLASDGVVAWDLLSQKTDYAFTRWNIEGDTRAEFDHLCALIHKVDMDIYIADYDHLGIYTCRIVVPGMSEIYSVDDLEWNNNNAGIVHRDRMLRLPDLCPTEAADLLAELDGANVDDTSYAAQWIGVLPDAESVWADIRMGELKCLLAFAANDLDAAEKWLEWIVHFDQLSDERYRLYFCLVNCLALVKDPERDLQDYRQVLGLTHGEARVTRALDIINGYKVFEGFQSDTPALNSFVSHNKMLAAYKRLQECKKIL